MRASGSLDRAGGFPCPARSRRPEDHSTRAWMGTQAELGCPPWMPRRIWMLCDREWGD